MRPIVALATVIAAVLLSCAPAQAQWDAGATADLGAGYGELAVSQSILSGARGGGSGGSGGSSKGRPKDKKPKKAKKATARQLRALRFTSAPAVTEANDARLAETLLAACPLDRVGCPTNHPQLIADGLPTGQFRRGFRTNLKQTMRGSDRNVADVASGFILLVWQTQRARADRPDQLTGAERTGARRFLSGTRGALALDKKLRARSDAEQQRIAETLANVAQHGISLHRAYLDLGEAGTAEDLRRYLRRLAQDWLDVDVKQLRLTRKGFVRK